MILIKHRVNKIKDLKKLDKAYGVEIDIRSKGKKLYLHHDPYVKGESFTKWLKHYNHKIIVLNVKEEGLESQIIKILKKNKINNFFFHDQTFSTLLKNMNSTKVSIRFSEYEDLKNKNFLFKKIKWLWCDNFTRIDLKYNFLKYLKRKKVKICLVSPELVSLKRKKEIKKLYFNLKKKNLLPDAICAKNLKIWKNLIT
jgi:hypothetical protein